MSLNCFIIECLNDKNGITYGVDVYKCEKGFTVSPERKESIELKTERNL